MSHQSAPTEPQLQPGEALIALCGVIAKDEGISYTARGLLAMIFEYDGTGQDLSGPALLRMSGGMTPAQVMAAYRELVERGWLEDPEGYLAAHPAAPGGAL